MTKNNNGTFGELLEYLEIDIILPECIDEIPFNKNFFDKVDLEVNTENKIVITNPRYDGTKKVHTLTDFKDFIGTTLTISNRDDEGKPMLGRIIYRLDDICLGKELCSVAKS